MAQGSWLQVCWWLCLGWLNRLPGPGEFCRVAEKFLQRCHVLLHVGNGRWPLVPGLPLDGLEEMPDVDAIKPPSILVPRLNKKLRIGRSRIAAHLLFVELCFLDVLRVVSAGMGLLEHGKIGLEFLLFEVQIHQPRKQRGKPRPVSSSKCCERSERRASCSSSGFSMIRDNIWICR